MTKLAITLIRLDGGTQPRAELNQQTITDYAEAMQDGAKFPSITVFYDGEFNWLADGFHRLQATRLAKKTAIECDVRQGTRRDAVLFSVGVNSAHGLARSNQDKRRAAMTLLTDDEWQKWSNVEIAKRCAVSDEFVRQIRASLPTVGSENRNYTTKHGTPATMNIANIGTPPKFKIGQRVRHNGLIYDVSGVTSGGFYTLRTIGGKVISDIPGIEIELYGSTPIQSEESTSSEPNPVEDKTPSKGDLLKLQLIAANIMAFKVVVHTNGNSGTYSAGFFSDGTREQAEQEAQNYGALIQALGFKVLGAGADIAPGYGSLGFGGEHTPIVHFADANYQASEGAAQSEADEHHSSLNTDEPAEAAREEIGAATENASSSDDHPEISPQTTPETEPSREDRSPADPVEEDATNDEWYTPAAYIHAARDVMDEIDLDPASCAMANLTVRATTYFSKKDSGLEHAWFGRVWINPPYSFPLIREFIEKLIAEYSAGNIEEAIVLVNNRTDAEYFHQLMRFSSVCLFTSGRINFDRPGREMPGNRQGQAFFYIGDHVQKFTQAFGQFGTLMHCWGVMEATP